jgi:hypothetical protein
VLKLRGHNPIIHEKSDVLGGTFIAASAESYKGKLRDLLTWYKKQMTDLQIEVCLNDNVESVDAFKGNPVIVATGSTARVLRSVPGNEKMIEACDYLTGTPVGETVAVIGGGLTGCEIAYELALQGKKPIIVEMKDDSPTLTFNSIGRHQSMMVTTRIASNKSPWLYNTSVCDLHTVAISHGEGRFIATEAELKALAANGQIATQYVDLDGNPTYDIRFNPNESMMAIEGITSPDGRVLGKMAHSERIGNDIAKNIIGNKDQMIFRSGVEYFK